MIININWFSFRLKRHKDIKLFNVIQLQNCKFVRKNSVELVSFINVGQCENTFSMYVVLQIPPAGRGQRDTIYAKYILPDSEYM